MKSPQPLLRHLTIQLGWVIALQLVTVAVLAWLIILPQMRTDMQVGHQVLARSVAGQVATFLVDEESQLKALTDYIQVQGDVSASFWTSLLDAHCGNGDFFETIYMVNLKTETVTSVGLPVRRRSSREDIRGLDLSGRDFLKTVKARKRATWSETFLSAASGRMVVALAIPMGDQAIIGEISIEQLHHFISRLPAKAGLFTLILDRGERVVADSKGLFSGQKFFLPQWDIKKESLPKGMDPTEFEVDDRKYIGTAVGIEKLGWTVVVAQPIHEAFGPIQSTLLTIATGLVISFVLALLAMLLQARKITELFQSYTTQAQSIAQGDYDFEPPTSSIEEFALLGENLKVTAKTISRRERQLVASESNLSIILDSIGDAVIATDTEGVITRLNPSAEQLTGWPSWEAVGRGLEEVFQIFDSQSREPAADPVEQVLGRGEISRPANQAVLVDRTNREYQIAKTEAPIRRPDGRTIGVVLVFRDITESYLQEKKIRDNERFLNNITANVPGIVFQFRVTPEGAHTISYFNEKAAAILGLDLTTGDHFTEFLRHLPEEDRTRFSSSIMDAVAWEKPWNFEGRYFKNSGETGWFSANSIPSRERDELVYYGVFTDITARKKVQEDNLKRQKFLESVLFHAPDAIIPLDEEGRILDWNPGAVTMFGYAPEEAIGARLEDLAAAPEGIPREETSPRWPLSEKRVEAFEIVRLRKDKTPLHLIASGSPIVVDDSISGFVVVFTDITERKRWESALEDSERRYRELFNEAPVMYVITENRGQIPYIKDVNNMFLEVLGFRREEVLGTPMAQYYTPESARELLDGDGYRRALTGTFTAESRELKCRDGRVVHALLHALPDAEADGRVTGTRAMFLDVTALKKAEQEAKRLEAALWQSQKMEAIGTLAGGIAHDFNNILSAVIGYAELARVNIKKETRLLGNLQQILVAAMRASDLVRQILAFSHQDEGELKPLHLGPLVKEALKLMRSSLPATVEMVHDISDDVENVMAEPTQIHRIVMNLCTNAAQAMEEEGGQLTVQLSQVRLTIQDTRLHPGLKPGPFARLSVRDTGKGIHPGLIGRIFDPYFTTKEKGKGTGLGLSVVHGIVQRYGGAVFVDSEPDQGTVFQVYLPTVDMERVSEDQEDGQLPMGTEHILLVDDEPVLIEVGKKLLEMLGYTVTTRGGGMEALELFTAEADRFDLVISDVTMPKMTGDRLATELLRIRPDIPIILVTGFTQRMTDKKAEGVGVKTLIMKPITKKKLAETVRKVLDDTRSGNNQGLSHEK